LAVIYSFRGNKAKAEQHFREIVAIDPTDKRGLFNLGNHFGRSGEYQKSFLNYRKLQRRIGHDRDLVRIIPLALGHHAVTTGLDRKRRKYTAISLIESYDADEPDLDKIIPHLQILIELYKEIAEAESKPQTRNDYYDKALGIIRRLIDSGLVLGPELKLLERKRRYLAYMKYSA
jgi:tetratricopeptide (TPR) repeat protein